jgi:hypothetical protein
MKGAVTGFDIVPLSEVPGSVRVKGNKLSQAQLKKMLRKRNNGPKLARAVRDKAGK